MISDEHQRSRFDLREQIRRVRSQHHRARCRGEIGIDVQKANGRDFGLFRLACPLPSGFTSLALK